MKNSLAVYSWTLLKHSRQACLAGAGSNCACWNLGVVVVDSEVTSDPFHKGGSTNSESLPELSVDLPSVLKL